MPRAAQSPSHQLALGVALVAILAIGAWAVFDDVPSAKEALAAFSAPDTPAPAAWSRTADGWPVAQASPVAATPGVRTETMSRILLCLQPTRRSDDLARPESDAHEAT